jgi:predicted nucleic acid-binding Zn ribbon protein
MPEDHRHCKVCGTVCEPEEEVCSPACRTKRERVLQTRRTYTYVLYGLILVILVLFVLPYFGL